MTGDTLANTFLLMTFEKTVQKDAQRVTDGKGEALARDIQGNDAEKADQGAADFLERRSVLLDEKEGKANVKQGAHLLDEGSFGAVRHGEPEIRKAVVQNDGEKSREQNGEDRALDGAVGATVPCQREQADHRAANGEADAGKEEDICRSLDAVYRKALFYHGEQRAPEQHRQKGKPDCFVFVRCKHLKSFSFPIRCRVRRGVVGCLLGIRCLRGGQGGAAKARVQLLCDRRAPGEWGWEKSSP